LSQLLLLLLLVTVNVQNSLCPATGTSYSCQLDNIKRFLLAAANTDRQIRNAL